MGSLSSSASYVRHIQTLHVAKHEHHCLLALQQPECDHHGCSGFAAASVRQSRQTLRNWQAYSACPCGSQGICIHLGPQTFSKHMMQLKSHLKVHDITARAVLLWPKAYPRSILYSAYSMCFMWHTWLLVRELGGHRSLFTADNVIFVQNLPAVIWKALCSSLGSHQSLHTLSLAGSGIGDSTLQVQ